MATSISFNLQETPLEGLRKVQKEIEQEIKRREITEHKKLIENFRSAFSALCSAGIGVYVTDCNNETNTRIYPTDNFYFN